MLLVIVTFVRFVQQTVHLKNTEIQLIGFYTLIQQNIKKSLSVHNSNNSILFNKEYILPLITIRKKNETIEGAVCSERLQFVIVPISVMEKTINIRKTTTHRAAIKI